MTNRYVLAFLTLVLAIGFKVHAATATLDEAGIPDVKQLHKVYQASTAASARTADLREEHVGGLALASTVTYMYRMPLQPMPEEPAYDGGLYNNGYGYIPGDYSREGFTIDPGNWWIGNQPYLPYYGYNPPTTNGYYPPYASANGYGGGYGYGYPGYGQIVPAPPLASPPAYVPTFTRPVPPAPLIISRGRNGGFVVQRDPHFQLFFVPQPPNYLTTGSAIYQRPPQYYYYSYPYPWNR